MTKPIPSSEDAFQDSLNFVKKIWGGMGVPGMNASSMPTMPNMGMPMPTMSVEEMDKRIQELKSVETWLNMNLTMLRSTIQALEIQRATIATLHSLSSTMSQTMQATASGNADEKKEDVDSTAVPPFVNQSAAWWNTVQEQFKQALGAALEKSTANAETVKSATENVKKPVTKRTTKVKSASASKTRK